MLQKIISEIEVDIINKLLDGFISNSSVVNSILPCTPNILTPFLIS